MGVFSLLRGVLLFCVFLASSAIDISSCPHKCTCLGNIVDCSETQMTSLPPNIGNYPWIEQLQLNQNPGLNLTGGELSQLPNLSVLELESLGLESWPPLGELPALTRLSLRDNSISTIGDMSGVLNLRHLDLSRNQITELRLDMPLVHLKKLNLDRNRISRIIGSESRLTALQELRLFKNSLTHESIADSALLRHVPDLTFLNLNSNKLQRVSALMFQNCSSLRVLKMSRNELSELSDGAFFGLDNLVTLTLDHNNLTVVSKAWLFGLKSLEEITLRHNVISSISPLSWHNNALRLVSLDLGFNKLVAIHPASLQGLDKLEYLDLTHNELSAIMAGSFVKTPNLMQLDLSNNHLRWAVEDNGNAFKGLQSLNRLVLSYNEIEVVQYEALAPMSSLTKLNLEGNSVKTLNNSPFRSMVPDPKEEPQIVLNSSSIVCDCHLDWFADWYRTTRLHIGQMTAHCSYPPAMVGKLVTEIPLGEELPCAHSPRPVILRSPQDRIVLLDAEVSLSCEATVGSRGGEPVLMWKRNHHLVEPYKLQKKMKVEKGDPDGGIISRVESILHLSHVSHQDGGHYQCIVQNEFGTDYSERALIEVQVKPKFIELPTSVHTQVNGVARIQCAAEGLPPPEISLKKGDNDDFPAAIERRLIADAENHVFFIKPVKLEDQGTYTCTARNTAGMATASANVSVSEAPYFSHPVYDITVRAGEKAVLRCQVGGNPKPSITWLKNSEALSQRNKNRYLTLEDGEYLLLMKTNSTDEGDYTCQISNGYGTRRHTMRLTIYDGLLIDGMTAVGLALMSGIVCIVTTSVCCILCHVYKKRQNIKPTVTKFASSRHFPSMGFPPHSPSSTEGFNGTHVVYPPATTDPLIESGGEHGGTTTGPDNSSEHSTGKDSGVGDSSQRSNEDLRQVGGVDGGSNGGGDRFHPPSPALTDTTDGGNTSQLQADSAISVYTEDSADLRPRLSTFGSNASATLRRPSGHKPIPVSMPSVLPHHLTATLPHRGSFRANRHKPPGRDHSPHHGYLTNRRNCSPTRRYEMGEMVTAKCLAPDAPTDDSQSTMEDRKTLLSSPGGISPDIVRVGRPDSAPLKLADIYRQRSELRKGSEYSNPSVLYSQSNGVCLDTDR